MKLSLGWKPFLLKCSLSENIDSQIYMHVKSYSSFKHLKYLFKAITKKKSGILADGAISWLQQNVSEILPCHVWPSEDISNVPLLYTSNILANYETEDGKNLYLQI